jgi:predicted nucleic acid-binding Zn ribbon protein
MDNRGACSERCRDLHEDKLDHKRSTHQGLLATGIAFMVLAAVVLWAVTALADYRVGQTVQNFRALACEEERYARMLAAPTSDEAAKKLWATIEPLNVCRWMDFRSAVFYNVTYRGAYAVVVELRPNLHSSQSLYMVTTVNVEDTGA